MMIENPDLVQPEFGLLTKDQCHTIIQGAIQVLERTGMIVHSPAARDLLRRHGARLADGRVRIGADMVEQAFATAPDHFLIHNHDGDTNKELAINPYQIHYGPSITAANFHDPYTGKLRAFTCPDAAVVAKVCDALPNIDYVSAQGTLSDVDQDLIEVYEFSTLMENSGKPVMAWSNSLEGCHDIHAIASVYAGGSKNLESRPNYFFLGCSITPLILPAEVADQIIFCGEQGVPFVFGPCPMCGATTPCSLASTLVIATAEGLFALVLSQLVRKGAPFMLGGSLSIMDMKTGSMPYGAPELALLGAGMTEIARAIGVPAWSTGGVSDAKQVDQQAALEGSITALVAGLAGADIIHNVGYLEGCLTGSLQHLVLMDEIIGYIKRIKRGFSITPESLALDSIHEMGPGGNFLSTRSTVKNCRREFWYPNLLDRQTRERWEQSGSQSLLERVQAKLVQIIESEQPPVFSSAIHQSVGEILKAAAQRKNSH